MVDASHSDPASSRALRRVGATLCGRYRLARLIGVGGMGAVYAGLHRNGHRVAVKVLHERLDDNPELERLFRREAHLANTVGHPGVVPVTDDDISEDGYVFLVMPLLHGETLRARWERSGRKLPLEEVCLVAHRTLEILGAAHAAKIVHRDIKPENIFLTRDGAVRVLDFGIARVFQANEGATATKSGRAVGTPAFMAPEQALGRHREIDGRTDLWALAATIFSLLSGRFVHEAESTSEVLVMAATRHAQGLARAAPEVPGAIADVVDRALRFRRGERWADAQEMDRGLLEAFQPCHPGVALDAVPLAVEGHDEHDDLHNASTDLHNAPTVVPAHVAPLPGSTDDVNAALSPHPRGATRTGTGAVLGPTRRGTDLRSLRVIALTIATLLGVATFVFIALRTLNTAPARERELSKDAGALAAYRAGTQAWKDASRETASAKFEEATQRDPAFAEAHLSYVANTFWPDDTMRAHFQRAAELRTEFTEEGLDLLDALEPLSRVPPAYAESTRRMGQVAGRYPSNSRVLEAFVTALIRAGREDEAVTALAHIPVNEHYPVLDYDRGIALALRGNVTESRAAFHACIDAAPSALSCLQHLGLLDTNEGQCVEAEAIARRQVAVDSHSSRNFTDLARALYANGESLTSVTSSLENAWRAAPPSEKLTMELEARTHLFFLSGDFEGAFRTIREWDEATEGSVDELMHVDPAMLAMHAQLELGQRSEVEAIATAYLARRKAWLAGSYYDYSLVPSIYRYLAGTISHGTFASEREAWLGRARSRDQAVASESLLWLMAFVRPVANEVDANEAIASMPASGIPDPMTRVAEADFLLGRMYYLAGRSQEALLHLRRAATSCSALEQSLVHTQAESLLGQVLEQSGDLTGACAAYGVVAARWGRDLRSASAKESARAFQRIHCKEHTRATSH